MDIKTIKMEVRTCQRMSDSWHQDHPTLEDFNQRPVVAMAYFVKAANTLLEQIDELEYEKRALQDALNEARGLLDD